MNHLFALFLIMTGPQDNVILRSHVADFKTVQRCEASKVDVAVIGVLVASKDLQDHILNGDVSVRIECVEWTQL